MKLRNKKTGDIWEFDGGFSMKTSRVTAEKAGGRGCSMTCYANSIADLIENWEDVEPAEPLIKDEKIRKAVRAWAEANGIKDIVCFATEYGFKFAGNPISLEIRFNQLLEIDTDGIYTIAELCGEEEE